jgi:multicomponent Na+:H+ antiporter subunit C
MSVNITLLVVMGVLFTAGIYLLLERSLTRVMLGLMMLTNAANVLLLLTGGFSGRSPLYAAGVGAEEYSDPLPQALILTSIVIGFAVTAFMLGIIYRSWVLGRKDVVQDDIEDRRVASQPSFDAEDDAPMPVDTTEFTPAEAADEAAGSQNQRRINDSRRAQ